MVRGKYGKRLEDKKNCKSDIFVSVVAYFNSWVTYLFIGYY